MKNSSLNEVLVDLSNLIETVDNPQIATKEKSKYTMSFSNDFEVFEDVDAGIIYATDAKSANLQVVDLATKDMCKQVIYPAAVLNNTNYKDEAIRFLDFLKTNEAMKVFESVGFTKAN